MKKNGKVIEYNWNGELVFEGEYLVGKRWNGKGKEYNDDGILIFEEVYLNGEKKNKKIKKLKDIKFWINILFK